MSYYSQSTHFLPDDTTEIDERQERIEVEAGRWFADMTKRQKARFDERMAGASAYRGTELWDRARAAAEMEWRLSTKDANRILSMIMKDLEATGEVSPAVAQAADDIIARQRNVA